MIVGLVTVGLSLVYNLLALVVSWRLDARGLPAGRAGQFAVRKPGTLRARLPNIGLNLMGQWLGALGAFWLFEAWFRLDWPGLGVVAAQLAIVVALDDVWFYWMHRWMHRHPGLYRRIHKQHHEAFAPVPIEYIYVHPLEQTAGTLGIVVGFALCGALFEAISAWTVWIFLTWRVAHELEIHSGLLLPSRHLPGLAPMAHHDLHHARPTLGNYASTFLLWDRLLGTEIDREAVRRPRPRGEAGSTG